MVEGGTYFPGCKGDKKRWLRGLQNKQRCLPSQGKLGTRGYSEGICIFWELWGLEHS